MVGKPEVDEFELSAAVDALKGVSAEEQEAAILELEEKHPGIGERIRALLALEKQAAEHIKRLEKQGREVEEPKVVEQKTVEPKKSGEIIALVDGRQVRFPRRGFGAAPALKVVQQAKPEPEPEPEPIVKVEVVRDEEDEPPRRPVVSKLGIAPGLVGEVADFTVSSAMYPSIGYALGGSIPFIGTLIGRRIAGPSGPLGTGTHLYLALVGPTGSGKEHIRTTIKLLMTTASAAALIGPGRFKSGAAIMGYLVKKPLSLCVMDEFGSMLGRITHKTAQFYQLDETEVMREIWGINWGRYDSPEGAYSASEAVLAPALSIVGMSTPKELWRACKSRDIANGFLNRFLFIEEKVAPKYQRVGEDALVVPKELKMGLARLINRRQR